MPGIEVSDLIWRGFIAVVTLLLGIVTAGTGYLFAITWSHHGSINRHEFRLDNHRDRIAECTAMVPRFSGLESTSAQILPQLKTQESQLDTIQREIWQIKRDVAAVQKRQPSAGD